MESNRAIWIVIADGEHARLATRTPAGGFRSHRVLDSPAAHMHSAELGDDRPATTFDSGSGRRQSVTPKQDLHEREKRHFAEQVAEELNRESARGTFGRFVLIAPARVASLIRARLHASTKDKLVGTLLKDLVRVPDHELIDHLDRWARSDETLGSLEALFDVAPGSRRVAIESGKEIS
jgi:protein required for attachment to host cells